MGISYSKLWQTLDEKGMSKSDLKNTANISGNIIAKLTSGQLVSLETLEKICLSLNCDIEKILTISKEKRASTGNKNNKSLSGTFVPNKNEPIHRWYSYIEGYASSFINNELNQLKGIKTIYDPFGGTGTTLLAASCRGIVPYYSETNPFMCSIVDTKINSIIEIIRKEIGSNVLESFRDLIKKWKPKESTELLDYGGFEKYYSNDVLSDILQLKEMVENIDCEDSRQIARLALSSIVVTSSKMIRRGDLRFAKETEKRHDKDVKSLYLDKLNDIIYDINNYGKLVKQKVIRLSYDARLINEKNLVDCVITSPPYLNGTNYIRNTKLELKLNGFVDKEDSLSQFHSKGIVAGINNVSKSNIDSIVLKEVKPYLEKLVPVAYDKRIPQMVQQYFYDMSHVLEKLKDILNNGGVFIMDIGDSQFAGIHIPTHTILTSLAEQIGFTKYSEEILRKRKSKNGMDLTQRILRFKLHKEEI